MAGYKRHLGGDRWELCVSMGTDFTGKRKRFSKTVHCSSARQADKELSKFYASCEEGFFNPSTPITIKDIAELYLEEHAKRFHKKSTLRSDNTAINIWIIPYLGKRKITTLKMYDVQRWVNMMSDDGKSPKTVKNYFTVLSDIMEYALHSELITTNPCRKVHLPAAIKHEAQIYQKEDLEKLIKALDALPYKDLKYKCATELAIFGGFRKGEVLGFNWNDIDFDTNTVHVRRTRMIAPGIGVYEDSPKTEKSLRDVTLPGFIFDDLKTLSKQHKEDKLKFGQYYADSPAVIRAEDGDPLYPQVLQRWFTRFCNNNDLPCYGLHSLRHTHASLLASLGANYLMVSSRLGHANVSTTLDIYSHIFDNPDKTLSDQLVDFKTKIAK